MTYKQTLNFLYSKLPMFTRVGAVALKKDIHNTVKLCAAIGNPHTKFKTIHIAGTNGKGSTSHMLAAVFQKAGYKTGLYTSPHLKDFRERIRINGKMMAKSAVKTFVVSQKQNIEAIEPSFFEVTVAMAFDYFAKEKVDIAIIEVGLGGRLDSTNIITPALSIITNISLDHTQILGNTLAEIAAEKAGIIKQSIPVVIGEKQAETEALFLNKAKACASKIYFAENNLTINKVTTKKNNLSLAIYKANQPIFEDLKIDLKGTYQLKNVKTVLQAILTLREMGFVLPNAAIYSGLKNVNKITGLQGRWQTLSRKPLTICDTGHNLAGITEVLQNIKNTPHQTLHLVMGMVKDKDIDAVLAILPKNAHYYFCAPLLERALAAPDLAQKANALGLKGKSYASVKTALNAAKLQAKAHDLIFIGGSNFVVAEII